MSLEKSLRLKCQFTFERSKACTCHTGYQKMVDIFVLKLIVARILKIRILDAMSADIRMTWLENFNINEIDYQYN